MRPRLKWHMLRSAKTDAAHDRLNLIGALAAGEAAEIDLVFTADGHPLCLHDLTLDRETTGEGPVTAATRSAIERLRQRAPDGRPLHTAPLFFDEVVAAVGAAGRPDGGLLQIDLKEPAERIDAARLDRLAAILGDLAPRFVVGGTDWSSVSRIRRAILGLRAGFDPLACYGEDLPDRPAWFEALGRFAFETAPDADIFYLEARLLLAGLDAGVNLVRIVGAAGAEVDAWTIDADRPGLHGLLRRLVAAGCRQITTNDPLRLAPILEEICP